MVELLRFFQRFEAVLYFLLGMGIIIYSWKFWLAWEELREAVFGLERSGAQQRLNRNALMIFFLLLFGVAVFSLVTFVGPTLAPETVLPIAPTAVVSVSEDGEVVEGEQPAVFETPTALPTVAISPEGCVPERIFISSPAAGENISGEVTIEGTVQVENFGFYKIEYARAQEELWLTIQAGRNMRVEDELVPAWDTRNIPPGEYVLQLVVTDSAGTALPPCRIPIRISPAP